MEQIQLIGLGYAGSVAANFNLLRPYLGEEIVLSSVEYRGRGSRNREREYQSNEEMAADVAEQIRAMRRRELPYAVLGYSMGAQVLYELFAQNLLSEVPICIFLAAHEPPDVDCFGKKVDLDDPEAFLEHVRTYGGLDERLLQDERFASILLSRMKIDFQLLKSYRFSGEYHKFPSKVVVLYCEQDTPYQFMQGWKKFAKQEIPFYQIGEGHFFFKTDTEKFCKIIKDEMKNYYVNEINILKRD